MFLRNRHIMKIAAPCILGLGLLALSTTALAGSNIQLTVANNGMTSWTINGQANPTLTLLRNESYDFVLQGVPANHPFNINTANTTGSGSQYTVGVTNNGATGSAIITFVVPDDAPDSLHYNCGNHPAMNGAITIITDVLFVDGFDSIPVVAAN